MLPYIKLFNREIPTYGIFFVLALCVTTAIAIKQAKKENINWDIIILIVAVTLPFSLLGGGFLYDVITYSFSGLITLLQTRGLLYVISSTGLVFYGGFFGALIGLWVALKLASKISYQPINYRKILKIIIPLIPLGHAIGRIGCLFAGCCYGIVYSGIGAVTYPNTYNGHILGVSYFPVQVLEAFLLFLEYLILNRLKNRYGALELFFLYLIFYSVIRFFTEFLRGDLIRGFLFGLSTSQVISLIIFICSVFFFLIYSRRTSSNIG